MKGQDLNPEQQAELKVESDIGGQEDWDPAYNGGAVYM
jgi:hypothetical protein